MFAANRTIPIWVGKLHRTKHIEFGLVRFEGLGLGLIVGFKQPLRKQLEQTHLRNWATPIKTKPFKWKLDLQTSPTFANHYCTDQKMEYLVLTFETLGFAHARLLY